MAHTKDRVHEEVNHNINSKENHSTNILESSGILDAYEYFLRQLCKNGLPSGNVYEFAAQQMLKFERKRNAEIKKRVALKNSLEALESQQQQQDQIKENKINTKSPEKKTQQQKEQGKNSQQVPSQPTPNNQKTAGSSQQNPKEKQNEKLPQEQIDKKSDSNKVEKQKKQ